MKQDTLNGLIAGLIVVAGFLLLFTWSALPAAEAESRTASSFIAE